MSQIQELEEKLKILKQIETLDAPDELKQQFKDLVDKPKQQAVQAPVAPSKPDKGPALKYNKPEYDEIIDNLQVDEALKEKLKIINHHFVKTSFFRGAKYKGYSRLKMIDYGVLAIPPLKYYQAGFNKKWLLMLIPVVNSYGCYHYYHDMFRKLVLKEEDFWW